jgi:hypothetical protein
MKESEWSEAEKACVELAKIHKTGSGDLNVIGKALDAGLKLLAELEPDKGSFVLMCDGHTNMRDWIDKDTSLQGNTFETRLLAEEESTRREAETRVREKINLANKGDNGFKVEGENWLIHYNNNKTDGLSALWANYRQCGFCWEYIKTHEIAKELLKDKEFVADWLKMKGIKE